MQSYKQAISSEYFRQDSIQIVRMHCRGVSGESFALKQINSIDFLIAFLICLYWLTFKVTETFSEEHHLFMRVNNHKKWKVKKIFLTSSFLIWYPLKIWTFIQ